MSDDESSGGDDGGKSGESGESGPSGDKGSDGTGRGGQHLRLAPPIPLPSAAERFKEGCVTKLHELLGEAQRGKFRAVTVILLNADGSQSITWTNLPGAYLVEVLGTMPLLESELLKLMPVSRPPNK